MKGILLMMEILEIVDSEGATVLEIGETLSAVADTTDGSDVGVLEKEDTKAAWAIRMLRPKFLATFFREGIILSQLKKK